MNERKKETNSFLVDCRKIHADDGTVWIEKDKKFASFYSLMKDLLESEDLLPCCRLQKIHEIIPQEGVCEWMRNERKEKRKISSQTFSFLSFSITRSSFESNEGHRLGFQTSSNK
jgi:hypothetical protein